MLRSIFFPVFFEVRRSLKVLPFTAPDLNSGSSAVPSLKLPTWSNADFEESTD
jgi:hypothetical protein